MIFFSDLIYHATLEQQLMDCFPKDTFEKLQLPTSTYPTFYQGLPRYSEAQYPKHLFVKKEFANLSILKKRCVDKALLSIYRSSPLSKAHTLVLFTYVIPGGLGDYFAQQLVKKILEAAFPTLKLYTLSLFHETAPCHLLQETHEDYLVRFSSSNPPYFPKHLLKLLRNASMILQIPTFYPHFDLLLTSLNKEPSFLPFPKIETIGEYGFINSETFYPSTPTRCLGLHFLEHGLLLEDLPSLHPQPSLTNTLLIDLLFQKKSLHEYQASSHFYFAYLCTEYGHALYLYTLLLYLRNSSKNIDLCTPDIGFFLKALEKEPSLFKKAGVREIKIYYKNHCSFLPIQERGKQLRIIHTEHLTHIEFQSLMQLSEEPLGIRGNLSLSEAISLNKTYVYDPLEHNLTLYHSLIAMARRHTPNALKMLSFYRESSSPLQNAELLAILMQTTPALRELRFLNELIKKNHSANFHLENLVLRTLTHYENSRIEKEESSLVESFSRGSLSFEDLVKAVILLNNTFQRNPN